MFSNINKAPTISILVFASCFLMGTTMAQSPVGLTIDTRSPGQEIAPDFGVFSFETGSLQYGNKSYNPNGYFFNATNTQLVTLFRNLGVKSIRLGGNSVDGSYIPSTNDIDSFFGFAQAAGMKAVFSLDLAHGTPSQDATVAQYVWQNYRSNTICFAIGNEPTEYKNNGLYPTITNFSSYFSVWQNFASAVIGVVPDVKIGGPDNDGSTFSWDSGLAQAEQGSTNVVSVFYHYKPLGSANGKTTQQMIAGELSSNLDSSSYPSCYNSLGPVAQSYGFSYRVSEFNDYVAPTNAGVMDDTFATGLFALDALEWWAAHGSLGLHFHTGLHGFHAGFFIDGSGNYQLYPISYGIAAFNVGGYGDTEPLTMTNANGLNLTAYAVGNGTNLYVTIINKEYGTNARSAAVTVTPNGIGSGTVSAMFLTQTNGDVTATNGVTLGGASISGTGPWPGQWTDLGALSNGQCIVAVPAASAAIVRIQAAITPAPVIVQDLPAQEPMVTGKSYQYSIGVEGDSPLNYQWYQDGTPLTGQTNASYTVTAGSPGASATYYVIVTNVYGAATSSVSTFTSIAQLTSSFATTLLQFHPAGYWPMHETEAAAPGDIETNYGSLGLLGTGYYPDWANANGNIIQRQVPGALANDSDPAAHFTQLRLSGSGVSFTNGLFVPHTSPLATLIPPFSVECWFYPTNTSTGVAIWGQTDYEGFNAGAVGGKVNYNGIILNWVNGTFVPYGFSGMNGGIANSNKLDGNGSPGEPINHWYHLLVTCDANTNFSLYVNGSLVAGPTADAGVYAPDFWSPLSIGSGLGGDRCIAGSVDEVAVYTNVIGDISSHYNDGVSGASGQYFNDVQNDNPVIYLRMDAPPYLAPPPNTWPVLINYGFAGGDGVYTPGTVPGVVSMPAFAGLAGAPVAQLSGVSSFADGGYSEAFNPTGSNASFTICAMFRGNPCDNRVQTIVGHGTNSWQLSVTTNGCLVFNAGNGNSAIEGTGQNAGDLRTHGIYNDGNWHQVVAVARTNVISIYMDGMLDTNGTPSGITATSMIPGNAGDVLIGSDPSYTNTPAGVGRQFAGQICEVAFFTNALSANQIQQIYNAALQAVVNTTPTNILFSNSGGQLTLSWPADHIGWQLQSNPVGLTATGAWFTITGSTITNQMTFTPDQTRTNVFFRMLYQP